MGDHFIHCNPNVKINPKRNYVLRLWDYNWPIGEGALSYKAYMEQAIARFQKEYPNIRVELTLLDFLTGPTLMGKALQSNNAPDVYCSAYGTPGFNFKRQVPVGPFLKRVEREVYLSFLIRLTSQTGILCDFPRWVAPGLWIGNRSLLESAGFSIAEIQEHGWTWDDLIAASNRIPAGKFMLVGNPGPNGFFPQLVANGYTTGSENYWSEHGVTVAVDFLDTMVQKKLIPNDFDQNMIGRFMAEQSLLLAGVRPSLYAYINQKQIINKTGWTPILLPVPVRSHSKEVLLVENSVISIFRNRKTTGDDHIAAAVRLGQYLSTYENTYPWEQMMVAPASKNNFSNWLKKAPFNGKIIAQLFYQAQVSHLQLVPGYQEKVYPVLLELFTKKISSTEAKDRLSKISMNGF